MRTRDAVRIDIRAAEIAYELYFNKRNIMEGIEMAGWMRAADNRERGSCESHDWQAGWFAAQIWEDLLGPYVPHPDMPQPRQV